MKKSKSAAEAATNVTNLNNLVKDVKIAEELVSETICEDTTLDIWRDVEGFEGRYEVSFSGYLRFADRPDKKIVKCNKYGHYLRASLKHKGDSESQKNLAVHMLVAKAFVPNPKGYEFVKHINGRLTDNRADNLEWVETKPEKKKKRKRKSKRTSKPISASPILVDSDDVLLEGDVLERNLLECDAAGGYVPDEEVSVAEMSNDDQFEGDISESDVSDGEIWKDMIGFEGLYKISKSGKVVSLKHKKLRYMKSTARSTKNEGHLLSYNLSDKNGNKYHKMVHMLVAEHFIQNPLGYKYVMHIDGNPQNNNVGNLRWTERPVHHRVKKSKDYKKLEGKRNLMTTQEVEQYYTDGTYINTFRSILEAAEKTKFSYDSIKRVLDGKKSSIGGYVWKYSGNVYQTHINRTIVKEEVSKVSVPNWIYKVDKFLTFCNETITKGKNIVKSVFDNFQYTSVIPW